MPEELPIIVLNRILNFYGDSAHEALTVFGLVDKKNWNETVSKFGYDFWHRLSTEYYTSSLHAHRHNAHSFKQRWLVTPRSVLRVPVRANSNKKKIRVPTTTSMPPPPPPPHPPIASSSMSSALPGAEDPNPLESLAEIESCHENVALDFVCPITVSGMIATSEYTTEQLQVLFCSVCEKKVYPVKSVADFKKAQKDGRCVLISPEAQQAMKEEHKSDTSPNGPKIAINLSMFTRQNVALIVSSSSSFQRGQDMLRSVHKESVTRHGKDVRNFLSAQHLFMRCSASASPGPSVGVDLIQVDASSSKPLEKLDNDNQPKGGYQQIFVLDPSLSSLFDAKNLKANEASNSKLRAVIEAGKLVHTKQQESSSSSSSLSATSASGASSASSVSATVKDQDKGALALILLTVANQVQNGKPIAPPPPMMGAPPPPPQFLINQNSKLATQNQTSKKKH